MTDSISENSPVDPFAWITPERERLFALAVNTTQNHLFQFERTYPDSYERSEPLHRAYLLRLFLCSQLKLVFIDSVGVRFRNTKNIFMIVFDDSYVVHVKKLDPNTLLCKIPQTLLEVALPSLQLPLPLPDFEMYEEVPLENLYDLVVGYVLDEAGTFSQFMINDQEGQTVTKSYIIDLSQGGSSAPFINEEPPQAPPAPQTESKITLKTKKKERDDKQSREA